MATPDHPLPTHYLQILEPAQEPTGSLRDRLNQLSACELNTKVTYDVCTALSPPRNKILELLRPDDPGRDALEAIVRPIPRRGLIRPFDEDTKRFLQRALQPPSTYIPEAKSKGETKPKQNSERSLAEELREAEGDADRDREDWLSEKQQMELMEDDDSEGLSAAARKIDALLAESRVLHEELAGIQEDLQVQSARACRCVAAARALTDESRALRYLDDVVALLKGDVATALRTRAWPFAIGRRQPDRNYII